MTCNGCVATVTQRLLKDPAISDVEISLEQGKATLTMHHPLTDHHLQELLGSNGKYQITQAEGEPGPVLSEEPPTGEKSWLSTYMPLLLVFLFILGISTITSFYNGQFIFGRWMHSFMAGFFIAFSFFKFLDLDAFAESYAMYDVIARRIKAYGYLYPFLELALGIAYLTYFAPVITYTATIVIMGVSSIGVIQAVLNKKKIRCACLGAVFNLPMSTVTIIEDLLMVMMAVVMLVS